MTTVAKAVSLQAEFIAKTAARLSDDPFSATLHNALRRGMDYMGSLEVVLKYNPEHPFTSSYARATLQIAQKEGAIMPPALTTYSALFTLFGA